MQAEAEAGGARVQPRFGDAGPSGAGVGPDPRRNRHGAARAQILRDPDKVAAGGTAKLQRSAGPAGDPLAGGREIDECPMVAIRGGVGGAFTRRFVEPPPPAHLREQTCRLSKHVDRGGIG